MPQFARTNPPPLVTGDYTAFRTFVRVDFNRCCAFCPLHEFWAGGERNFELDHFRPVSLFPQQERDFYNIYYSCHVCNQLKHDHWPAPALERQGHSFVDLCRDAFETHYRLQQDGRTEPQTDAGRYTLLLLRLNSDYLVALRAFALRHGFRLDSPPE